MKCIIDGGIETGQSVADPAFAAPSFEAGGAEDFDDDQDYNKPEKVGPVCDQGLERLLSGQYVRSWETVLVAMPGELFYGRSKPGMVAETEGLLMELRKQSSMR